MASEDGMLTRYRFGDTEEQGAAKGEYQDLSVGSFQQGLFVLL
jgi:hypothetical protein